MSKKDLIKTLTSEIEAKFPEAKIVKVAPNPEIPGGTLLYVTRPENEDRLIALGEYASDRTVDILLDYGFHITVMPVVRNGEPAVA
ncbi:hypothetical protein KJ068_05830 [bacterium]|nr:hypothetical protein [bacterium]